MWRKLLSGLPEHRIGVVRSIVLCDSLSVSLLRAHCLSTTAALNMTFVHYGGSTHGGWMA